MDPEYQAQAVYRFIQRGVRFLHLKIRGGVVVGEVLSIRGGGGVVGEVLSIRGGVVGAFINSRGG